MSQALYTSKTGIAAGQTQINVIANNVANINTTAYKTANVTFSTLFSKTLSAGSAATTKGGGTNPKQIGLGTQVASISRDFNSGSFTATGFDSDFMISGKGYFVVQDADGNQYLTRDGHFSLDSDGNLTISNGYKVVGTSNSYTSISGNSTIKVATQLNATVSGTSAAELAQKKVTDLNCISLNQGTFVLNIGGVESTPMTGTFTPVDDNYEYDDGAGNTVTYTRLTSLDADRENLKAIYGSVDSSQTYYKGDDGTYIAGNIDGATNISAKKPPVMVSYAITSADLAGTVQDLVSNINSAMPQSGTPATPTVEFSLVDGKIVIENKTGKSLSVEPSLQSSNFLSQTGLDEAIEASTATQTKFFSSSINQSVVIKNATSYNDAASLKDWSISEGGVISATYSDGSSLTVMMDANDKVTWKYLTPENVTITGSGSAGTDVDTTSFDLGPSNMILELATVVNEGGLLAQTDNLWTIGPNTGEAYYGVAGGHGIGTLKAGGLEGSNVDMATELSNMIMAQRAIQVNSRVFSTASSILETLAYLGQ